ncbi:methyl-accepting chemotaxis protein [Sneathiella sp.]|jgi:methyl-accepting chemotaxis protein|uniref:methyl-accepting chemotaxis protein n=1 Tax=Sneathiella sp. TaxID=1964365 RepID=UPI0039E4AD3B
MTNGSSLFKSISPVIGAVLFTSAAFAIYLFTQNSFNFMSIAFVGALAAVAVVAFKFRLDARKAAQERDNMRLMLEARAGDMNHTGFQTSSHSADEIKKIENICKRLATGDFEARISHIEEGTDLTELMWSINELADRTDAFMREAAASMQHVADQKYYRRIIDFDMDGAFKRTAATINECTNMFEHRTNEFSDVIYQFEHTIGSVSKSIYESAEGLHHSADILSSHASDAATQVDNVNNAAISASSNVQTVASSAEEMSASIQEIGRQVRNSLENAQTASQMADSGNTKIKGLALAAQSIGEVVKLIEDIASQTNLLALNATIEAARAGDAGKGFAVVANEVKNLANQTAKATEDISKQIIDIQNATDEAVSSMETINSSVSDINHAVTAISSAMDEQNAATQEIAQSVASASESTVSVSNNIKTVKVSTEATSATSKKLLTEADALQEHSKGLEDNVSSFLEHVRKVV